MDSHQVSQDELKTNVSEEDLYFQRLDAERLAAQQRKVERQMLCPRDGSSLEVIEIHKVQVDRCPSCQGIWLDAHELEDILKSEEKPGFLQSVFGALIPNRSGS